MKKALLWILGLSCFAALGNGQDDAVSTPPPPNGWGVQGNVAWTKALHEAELEKAAAAARQQKALKQAMGSYTQASPPITTAEQFLAANRPPASASSPPGEFTPVNPVRRSEYVPAFEGVPARRARGEAAPAPPTSGSTTIDLPQRRFGLRDLFKGKEKGADGISGDPLPNPHVDPVPASTYTMPVEPVAPSTVGSNETNESPASDTMNESARGALEGPGPEKPSFFGRLFRKEESDAPGFVTETTVPAPAPIVEGSIPLDAGGESGGGVTAPPAYAAPSAPAGPAPTAGGERSIFVTREGGGGSGNSATVLATSQATVEGVLVRLYENTKVIVLERSGSEARILLADGREGIIAASALSR